MLVHIDPTCGVPAHRQIVDQVKRLIASGRLLPGQKLDSIRELAGILGVNPMTVAKAYRQLAAQGTLVARAGKGVFVAQPVTALAPSARRRQLGLLLDHLAAEAYQLAIPPREVIEMLRQRLGETAPPPGAGSAPPHPGRATGPRARGESRAEPPPPAPTEEPEDVSLL